MSRDPRLVLLTPVCRSYGHIFIRDYLFGFIPFGHPYCMRCGKRAES